MKDHLFQSDDEKRRRGEEKEEWKGGWKSLTRVDAAGIFRRQRTESRGQKIERKSVDDCVAWTLD